MYQTVKEDCKTMWNGGWIQTDSLMNTRDLGGMPTQDGRHIKPGRLIRAAMLSEGSAEDLKTLTDRHNLRTIVDLRGDAEISTSPDPVIEGVRYIKNPILDSQTLGISHEDDIGTVAKKMPEGYSHMVHVYEMFVHNDRALSRFKQFIGYVLQQKEGAILWHCTAGKDRTGIAAMILETALGVSQDLIMEDYLYTNVCSKAIVDMVMADILIKTDDEKVIASAREMMMAREEYIQAFITGMVLQSGSIDAFLKERLGLDEETKAQLQDMYLE